MNVGELLDHEESVSINLTVNDTLAILGSIYYNLDREYVLLEDGVTKETLGMGGYTDGKKIVFMIDDKADFDYLMFVAIHECIHIISQHIGRSEGRKKEVWQLAIDHVTNELCMDIASKTKLFKIDITGYIYFKEIGEKYPGADVEFIYDLLLKKHDAGNYKVELVDVPMKSVSSDDLHEQQKQQKNSGESGDKDSDGKSSPSESKGKDEGEGSPSDKPGPTVKYIKYTDGEGKEKYFPYELDVPEGTTIEEIADREDELQQRAKGLWNNNMVSRGNESWSITQYLDGIFKVEIPWDKITEDAILYPVQNWKKKTWKTPNIIIRHSARLPGKGSKSANPHTLYAGIDSSGSVGDEDLKRFIGVLVGSAQYYKKMTLYYHDTHASNPIHITTMNEQSIIEKANCISKRGGTSHKDLFDKIEEAYYTEKISLAVFLTDYYSDVNEIYKKYTWIYQVPTVWVLNVNDQKVNLNGCNYSTIYIN